MVAAPALHAAAMVAHDMGPVGETRAFDVAQRGELVFDGGLADLQEILLGRLDIFGADRRERLSPVEVVVRRGRVAGVRVRPRDETIGCHHCCGRRQSASLVAALEQPPRGLTPAPRVAGYRYAIALLIDAPGIPEGTPARILAMAIRRRALTEDNAVAESPSAARVRAIGASRCGSSAAWPPTWSTPAPATCARCAAGSRTRWAG